MFMQPMLLEKLRWFLASLGLQEGDVWRWRLLGCDNTSCSYIFWGRGFSSIWLSIFLEMLRNIFFKWMIPWGASWDLYSFLHLTEELIYHCCPLCSSLLCVIFHISLFLSIFINYVCRPEVQHSVAPLIPIITNIAYINLVPSYMTWFDFNNNIGCYDFMFVLLWEFKIFQTHHV